MIMEKKNLIGITLIIILLVLCGILIYLVYINSNQTMQKCYPEGNINFGVNLKKLIREGIQSLQRKAENFYGRDYICSLLVMD